MTAQWRSRVNLSVGILVAVLSTQAIGAAQSRRDHRTGERETRDHRESPTSEPGRLRGAFTIQHVHTGRYVDAYQSDRKDFRVVTRTTASNGPNGTQVWIFLPQGNDTYTIQQRSSRRYVDAHESEREDFHLVTRPPQGNDSQAWILTPQGNDTYRIRQKSSALYVDAHDTADRDYGVVARAFQPNTTQVWRIQRVQQ